MDKYEQEIFDFLTEQNNFEAMLKVKNNFTFIRKEVIKQFWELVNSNLKRKLGVNSKWKTFNPVNKDSSVAKLLVYKDMWIKHYNHPFVGVGWQELSTNSFYGVYNDINTNQIVGDKLTAELNNLRINLNFQFETNWWPMWQHGRYNFSEESSIIYILPANAAGVADEYSENIIALLNKTERIIDKILLQ